jgi:hypothetical protein
MKQLVGMMAVAIGVGLVLGSRSRHDGEQGGGGSH